MAINTFGRAGSVTDAGLAAYMTQIFNYMAGGVALSGFVAYFTLNNPEMLQLAAKTGLVFFIVWMGFAFFMHKIIFSLQPAMGLGIFAAFSGLTGFSLAPTLYFYTGAEITTAFTATAVMFGGASLYGYLTKKSLSGWSGFLGMASIGYIGLVLLIMGGSLLGFNVSGLSIVAAVISIPLFAGMTAYETNELKAMYSQFGGDDVAKSRMAILGAARLYMNFVIMFLNVLRLVGVMRD